MKNITKPIRPKKPLVSFLLYRISKQKEIKNIKKNNLSEISKEISKLWKNEKFEIKNFFKKKSEILKKEYYEKISEYEKKLEKFENFKKNEIILKKTFSRKSTNESFFNFENFVKKKKKIKKKKKKNKKKNLKVFKKNFNFFKK